VIPLPGVLGELRAFGVDAALRFFFRDVGRRELDPRFARFAALRGMRKTDMSTDEIMNLLRGYGEDAGGPGFKVTLGSARLRSSAAERTASV
jgi:hypothetical protein